MAAEHITDLASDYHLDLLATGVVLLDANLHIQALNLSAENLLEVSASRALGSALEELLDESNEWYPLLHQAMAENYPMVRRAIPLTTRTGQERTVDITLSPIAGKVKSRCLLVELNMVDRLQAISRDESEWQAQATLKGNHEGWPTRSKTRSAAFAAQRSFWQVNSATPICKSTPTSSSPRWIDCIRW